MSALVSSELSENTQRSSKHTQEETTSDKETDNSPKTDSHEHKFGEKGVF